MKGSLKMAYITLKLDTDATTESISDTIKSEVSSEAHRSFLF